MGSLELPLVIIFLGPRGTAYGPPETEYGRLWLLWQVTKACKIRSKMCARENTSKLPEA